MTQMKFAYIRLTTKSQDETRKNKIDKLKRLGIEERFVFIDKPNGQFYNYPSYEAMKRNLHEGDILYINNLNNLGRTYDDIIREWKHLTKTLRADIVALDEGDLFDSRKFREMGDIGKLMEDQFLALLSFFAKQEHERLKEEHYEKLSMLENQF